MKIIKSKGKVPKDIVASEEDEAQEQPSKKPGKPADPSRLQADVEKLKLQMDMLSELRTVTGERFSKLDGSIGELRAMMAQKDKDLNSLRISSAKAIEVVEQAKPERMLAELQKKDAKVATLESKIDAFSKVNEQIMNELKDAKQKLQTFKGLEEVQKLSRDVAKDLANMKIVQSKIDVDSNKVEKIFVDTQKKYEEMQRLKDIVNTLTKTATDNIKDVNDLKLKMANAPDKGQIEELKNIVKEKAEVFGKFSKDDMKALKEFIGKSGSIENQVSEVKSQLDKSLNILDMFTEKVNSLEQSFADMKLKKISGAAIDPQTIDAIKSVQKAIKDLPGLRGRVEELEEAVDKLTDMVKKVPGTASGKPSSSGETKALVEKIASLESSQNELEEAVDKLTDLIKSAPGPERRPPSQGKEIAEKFAKLEYGQKDISSLKARIQELEDAIGELSDMEEASTSGLKGSPVEASAVLTRMNMLEDNFKATIDKVHSIDSDVSDIKKVIEEASREPDSPESQPGQSIMPPTPPDVSPEIIKSATERLDSMDGRITGINDKLVQVSADVQKISDYIMDGIKYIESRIGSLEKEMDSRQKVPGRPQPKYMPSTYSSHLRMSHELPEGGEVGPVPAPQRQAQYQVQPAMQPVPQRPKAQVVYINRDAPPSPPGPQSRTIFTKLREGTVVRKPYANVKISGDMHDIDILKEQIMEGSRRRDTREKITRDLLNAGFDQEMIDRAFLEARVEN